MDWWMLWACLLHLAVCFLLFILIKMNVLQLSAQIFPLAVFVPVWGVCVLIAAEIMLRMRKGGTRVLLVDDFKLGSQDVRSVGLYQDDRLASVVPFEEAIYLNDAKTRREFMMDIISQDAKQYIDLLQKAKFNNDIEVIHYASTAIMEIQREFELTLQRTEAAANANIHDEKALDSYLLALKNYIESGLVEHNILLIQRSRYRDALNRKLNMDAQDAEVYFEAADNFIELNDLNSAIALLHTAQKLWPGDIRSWSLELKICHATGDTEKRNQIIRTLTAQGHYLSAQAKELAGFWNQSPRRQEETKHAGT